MIPIIDKFKKNIDECVLRYSFFDNVIKLDTPEKSYILKKKRRHDLDIYNYLALKGFDNYIEKKTELDDYEIYPYIEENFTPNEDKALDLIYLMSILHNKTTYFEVLDQENIKELYEDIQNQIITTINYYDNVRYIIENEKYLPPSNYLLIRNITFIYSALDSARRYLDKWYELIKNKKRIRKCLIHNKLELSHLIESDKPYLLSWNHSRKDLPIYDFLNFYKLNQNLEFTSLFEVYNSKYHLYEEEKYLLFTLMLIPEKLEFNQSEIDNTIIVSSLLLHIENTFSFVSKYDSDYTTEQTHQF